MGSTPNPSQDASQPGAETAQMTVPTSLVDAVMDVDAAVDDGGLELQEALARMHEELAQIIPGPAGDPGPPTARPEPFAPEHSSSRS